MPPLRLLCAVVFALVVGCTGLRHDERETDRDSGVREGGAAGAAGDAAAAGDGAATGNDATSGTGGLDANMDGGGGACQPGVFDDSRFDQACFQ